MEIYMKNLKFKPYQKLLVLFEQKAKLRTSAPFGYVELSVEEIENSLANEIHMYRLSTYIWHIKVNVGGIVSSVRGDTPETKRKVVAYRIHNWDNQRSAGRGVIEGVRQALVRQGLMIAGTSNSTYKFRDGIVSKPKMFRPKESEQVKTLKDLKAQPVEYKTEEKPKEVA